MNDTDAASGERMIHIIALVNMIVLALVGVILVYFPNLWLRMQSKTGETAASTPIWVFIVVLVIGGLLFVYLKPRAESFFGPTEDAHE